MYPARVSVCLVREFVRCREAQHPVSALGRPQLSVLRLLRKQGRAYAQPRPVGVAGDAVRPDVRWLSAVRPISRNADDRPLARGGPDGPFYLAAAGGGAGAAGSTPGQG